MKSWPQGPPCCSGTPQAHSHLCAFVLVVPLPARCFHPHLEFLNPHSSGSWAVRKEEDWGPRGGWEWRRPQAEAGALNTVTSPSWCTGRGLVLTLTPSGPKRLPHAPGLGRGYAAPGLGWSPSSLPTLLRLQADSRCTLSLSFPIRKMGGHSDRHRVGSHSFGLHPSASLH